MYSTKSCPKAWISFCSSNISLHALQCFPSVNPTSVHVGSFLASISSICCASTSNSVFISGLLLYCISILFFPHFSAYGQFTIVYSVVFSLS